MGYSYLNNKNWSEITREERFFCSHLYHALLNEENKRIFLGLLKGENSPAENIPISSLMDINTEDEWEAGFEVCFYRDLLHKYGISVKKNDLKIAHKEKMIKRTFDLCLFNKSAIIIIEAKCLSDLNNDQYSDFGLDRSFIKATYDYLKENHTMEWQEIIVPPEKIFMVFLASTKYYQSASFKKTKGIGKKIIDDFRTDSAYKFDKFISWKQLELLPNQPLVPGIFKKANDE